MNRIAEDIKRKEFFGNTHHCLDCRQRFHADKDGCPSCGSYNIRSTVPPIDPQDLKPGKFTLFVEQKPEGVNFHFIKKGEREKGENQ